MASLIFRSWLSELNMCGRHRVLVLSPPVSNVTNLCSMFHLTAAQREILERDLAFIPTPTGHAKIQMRKDLHMYHRRLKILDHFQYQSDYVPDPFCDPLQWEPEWQDISPHIRELIEGDRKTLEALHVGWNLNQTSLQARDVL